jgi:iron-sulfur cluster repair protein YtfE (RIC family)
MCHYCGCRQIPLIRDYIAEHDQVLDHGDRAMRAIDAGDLAEAAEQVRLMHAELRSHWEGEEKGVFAVLMGEELYREHIEPLVAEHRELDELLGRIDVHRGEDQALLREQVAELRVHISKEEDGIFPATLTELSGAEWDRAIAAWQAAHPGQELIAD